MTTLCYDLLLYLPAELFFDKFTHFRFSICLKTQAIVFDGLRFKFQGIVDYIMLFCYKWRMSNHIMGNLSLKSDGDVGSEGHPYYKILNLLEIE